MVRFLVATAAMAVLTSTLGCRMCAHPYDYCGPRFTGGCGQCCDPMGRAGSILAGGQVEPGVEMQAPGGELMPVPEDQTSSAPASPRQMTARRPVYRNGSAPMAGQRW